MSNKHETAMSLAMTAAAFKQMGEAAQLVGVRTTQMLKDIAVAQKGTLKRKLNKVLDTKDE